MPSCRTAVIRRSKADAEVRRVRLRSLQDQDAPTLRLVTGDELRSSAPLARCRRNRSRSRQEHPAAAYLCWPTCFECQGMRARGSQGRQPRRHLPAVGPSPQEGPLLGGRVAPGHWLPRAGDRIALCAQARPGCCADVMASRRVGYRPHRLAVRMWTVSGVVPWAAGVRNVSIQIVPHRVTGRVVAARSG
jgi:hypothetical protein